MAAWAYYDPADFKEKRYELIPEGVYRVRIDKAENTVTRSEPVRDMIKLTLSVSGHNSKLWFYIVLDNSDDNAIKKTNQALGTVFNCFGIDNYTMDIREWEGRVGGARVRHRKDAQGIDRADVAYLLYAKEVALLPAWQEGSNGTINTDMVSSTDNPHHIPF